MFFYTVTPVLTLAQESSVLMILMIQINCVSVYLVFYLFIYLSGYIT